MVDPGGRQECLTRNVCRNWILHPYPCFVAVDSNSIVDQLVRKKPLGHELFAVIMRRMGQIDPDNNKDAPRNRWRKFMEPDFATIVLSNADPMAMQSTHELFGGYKNLYDIAATRMWYIPAILEDGWVVYLYDMQTKRMTVLDPAVGPFGFTNRQIKIHEYVSSKLLVAFFHCVGKFFNSWVCDIEGWRRALPIVIDDKFASEESRLCATFLAKHYDGDKLLTQLTEENLSIHKQNTLYDVLRLEGNNSALPSDALEAIKNSFCVL